MGIRVRQVDVVTQICRDRHTLHVRHVAYILIFRKIIHASYIQYKMMNSYFYSARRRRKILRVHGKGIRALLDGFSISVCVCAQRRNAPDCQNMQSASLTLKYLRIWLKYLRSGTTPPPPGGGIC